MKPLAWCGALCLFLLMALSGCKDCCEPCCESTPPPRPELLTEDNPPPRPTALGSLKGVVKYDGDPPEPRVRKLEENHRYGCTCTEVVDESVVVDKATHGIKWAMVRIIDATDKSVPPLHRPYQLSLKGCVYSPHVVVVPPGTDLEILNPDKVMHNIHTLPFDSEIPAQNYLFDSSKPVSIYKGKWLAEPDIVQINCDIHGWMKGFILVHDPRYCAVTPADGTFEIKNLPPGKYKLSIWHETFGNYMNKEAIEIEIKPGAVTDLGDVKFAPKKK